MVSETLLVLGKLEFIESISLTLMYGGLGVSAVGWLWLVFQNYRMDPVQGILSIVPLFALLFALFSLEHRYKTQFTSIFLGGFVLGALGNVLIYSVDVCNADARCSVPPIQTDEDESGDDSETESSSLDLSLWLTHS